MCCTSDGKAVSSPRNMNQTNMYPQTKTGCGNTCPHPVLHIITNQPSYDFHRVYNFMPSLLSTSSLPSCLVQKNQS